MGFTDWMKDKFSGAGERLKLLFQILYSAIPWWTLFLKLLSAVIGKELQIRNNEIDGDTARELIVDEFVGAYQAEGDFGVDEFKLSMYVSDIREVLEKAVKFMWLVGIEDAMDVASKFFQEKQHDPWFKNPDYMSLYTSRPDK